MGRILAALLLASVVFAAVYASAASLGVTGGDLGAGGDTVDRCDTDGVTVSYTVSGSSVTHVTVNGISANCNGGQLSLTVVNNSGGSLGSGGPVAVDATSETVSVTPNPAASAVVGVRIVIVGP